MKQRIFFCNLILLLFIIAIFTNCNSNNISHDKTTYESKEIGKQVWMIENLNVSKFSNGDPILEAYTDDDWSNAGDKNKPAFCYYNNDPINEVKYGKLYNWSAMIDNRGLCPKGWHVPLEEEWATLFDYLGGEDSAGNKMKSTIGWKIYNGTNSSSFAGLPGGFRDYRTFSKIGYYGIWWIHSSTPETYNLKYDWDKVEHGFTNKQDGESVRCIKNK